MLLRLGEAATSAPIIISLKQQEKAQSKCNGDISKDKYTEKWAGWKRKGWCKTKEVKYLFNS